jgi:hypothetical protein
MGNEIKDFQIKIVTSADLKASQDSAKALQDVGAAGKESAATQVAAAGDVEVVEKQAFTSKAQLKQAVKGLKDEFPALGHIARMALNPITLIVAGIGSAWAIWTYRVKEMTAVLSGFELPDLSEKRVGQVRAMAKAYSDFTEALRKTREAYQSVDSASKREDERQDKQAERNKKLRESQKNLALAKLEHDKASLKPGEYEKRKAGIEDFYEGLGVKDTDDQKKAKLQRQAQREDDLARDAKAKLAEAAKIKAGTEEQDQQTGGDLQKQAEAAKAGKVTAQGRLKEIQDFREGVMDWQDKVGFTAKYGARYGTMPGSKAIDLEKGNIRSADSVIKNYNDWLNEAPNRKLARDRREELVGTAGKEAGEAETIHHDMWDKGGALDQFDADTAVNKKVQHNDQLTRANKAVGNVNDQVKQVTDEITKATEGQSRVLGAVLHKLAELRKEQNEQERRLHAQEGRAPRI